MLDLKAIREDKDTVIRRLSARNKDYTEEIEKIIALDEKRREIISEVERLKNYRNTESKKIGDMKKSGLDAGPLMEMVKEAGENIKRLDDGLLQIEQERNRIMLDIPNLPHPDVVSGKDEEDNIEIRKWGAPKSLGFKALDHMELTENTLGIDLERGVKLSQARFNVKKGEIAAMERALIDLMLTIHTVENGYTEYSVPFMVNRESMTGTGQLPKFEEDLYKLEGEDLFLIPTAEVPLTNLYSGEIIPVADLPLKAAAHTPCFRKEKFSHGKDVRGIIRQHQFHKVELVKFVRPEQSYDELQSLVADVEKVLQRLDIPYRVVMLSTGDLSFSSAMTYDIEAWMPAQEKYREVSSCSNFEAFQARRANIKYRDEDNRKEYVHTLNGSGLAVGRVLIAVLENYQCPDGSVDVPEALRPFMGGKDKILVR